MGRLSGFKYKDVARKPRSFGFAYDRQGKGSHEVWRHTGRGLVTRTTLRSPNLH